jgi:pimeloyl-ACP methyl ester carboxylesterase
MTTFLKHNRVELALHTLRAAGTGRPLLLLHGLGERSPERVPHDLERWPGPVHALDFTGHGASTLPKGGGYTSELLMADADTALAHLGEATVVGRGLGAYVALLLAGGRPTQVRGAILRDGPGLCGGGSSTTSSFIPFVDAHAVTPPDPYALVELAIDIRPPDYACIFARQAVQFSKLSQPVSVCARERPDWLTAVIGELGVEVASLRDALAAYAAGDA